MQYIAMHIFAVGGTGDNSFWTAFGPSLVAASISSVISLLSAILISWRLPTQNRRIDTSIRLIEQYNSEEMQAARHDVWLFLNAPQAQTKADNIEKFCTWVFDIKSDGGANIPTYQQAMRVLNFFAVVEVFLVHRQLVPSVIHAGLSYSYAGWRKMVLDPVRQALPPIENHKHHPSWRKAFVHLDRLVVDYSR